MEEWVPILGMAVMLLVFAIVATATVHHHKGNKGH